MPIRNKPGFIPKAARHQPDYYIELFGRINAVYFHPTTGATLYMEVDADIWNYDHYMSASGNLEVLYQADCRRMIRGRISTLREAMETVDAILDNPHFGEDFKHKPVHYEHDSRFANKNLIVPAKRFRRKGNGRPYRLTDADKAVLKGFGYPETDFGQIEQAANRGTFVLNDETPVNAREALAILGQETFLSGLGRAAFHRTCSREAPGGNDTVDFDCRALFRS